MIARKSCNVHIDEPDVVGLGDDARRCQQAPGDSSDIAQYTKKCLNSEASTLSRASPTAPSSADVVAVRPSVDQLAQFCHDTAATSTSCEPCMVSTSSDVLSSELQPMCSSAQRTKPAAPPTIEAADNTASEPQQHDVVHVVVKAEHTKCPQQCVEELDDGHQLKASSTTGSLMSRRQHSHTKQCSGTAAASMCDEKTVVASVSGCQEAEHATSSGLQPQQAAASPDAAAKLTCSNPAMAQVQVDRPTLAAQGPPAPPIATASDCALDTPGTTTATATAPQHQDPPSSSPAAHGTPGVSPSAAATGEAREELSGDTIAATRSGTAGSTGAEGNSVGEEGTPAQMAGQKEHRSRSGRVPSNGSSSMTCQIPGCGALLGSHTSSYFRRHRVCVAHAKADKVPMHGRDYRFCQQCGVLHPLEDFDGARKSCRVQLDKHNLRRRCRRKTQSKGSGPGGLDLPDDAEASGLAGMHGATYDGVRYGLTPVFWTGSPGQPGPQPGNSQVWGWGAADEGTDADRDGTEAAGFSEGNVVGVEAPHGQQGRTDWEYASGASGGAGAQQVRAWQQGKQPGHRTSSSKGWQGGGPATSNGAAPSVSTAARLGEWVLPPHAAEEAAAGHSGEEASYAAALAAAAAAAGGLQGPGGAAAAAAAVAAAAAAATSRPPRSSNPSAAAWLSAASQQSRQPTLVSTGGPGARMRGHFDPGMSQDPAMTIPLGKATAGLAHHAHHSTPAPSEARRLGAQPHGFAAGRSSHSGEGEGDHRGGQAPLSLQQLRLYIAAAIAAGNGPGLTRIREAGFVQQLLLVDELAHGILHEMQQDVQQPRQQLDAATHSVQRQSGQEIPGQTWGHGMLVRNHPQATANGGHHMNHDRAIDSTRAGRRAPQQQQQQQQRPFSAASSSMAEQHPAARVDDLGQNGLQGPAMDKARQVALPEGSVPPVALMALMEQIAKYASPAAAAAAGRAAPGPGGSSSAEAHQRHAAGAFHASLAHMADAAAAQSLAQAGVTSAALSPDNDGNSLRAPASGYKRPATSSQQSPNTKRPKAAAPEGTTYAPTGTSGSGAGAGSAHYSHSRGQVSAQRKPNMAAGAPYSNGAALPPSSRSMDGAQGAQREAAGMQGMAGQQLGRPIGLENLARYAHHMKQEAAQTSAAGARVLEEQRQEQKQQQQQHGRPSGVDATAALTHLLQHLASVVDGQKGAS